MKEEFDAYVLLEANETEAALQAFLNRFPDGAYAKTVTDKLVRLQTERDVQAKSLEEAKKRLRSRRSPSGNRPGKKTPRPHLLISTRNILAARMCRTPTG